MSMPTSAMAATATGFTWSAGSDPPDHADRPAGGEVLEPAERHLGAPGVVDAEEQDVRAGVGRSGMRELLVLDHQLLAGGLVEDVGGERRRRARRPPAGRR